MATDRLPTTVTFTAIDGRGLSEITIRSDRRETSGERVELLARLLPVARDVDRVCRRPHGRGDL